MKQPRIDAFVPKKPTMPELKSSLDDMPVIEKSRSPSPPPTSGESVHVSPERVNARTPERPNGKRIITRNSFEIYEDQMDTLRKVSLQEKMEGKLGSMSQMVREAIDDFLRKRITMK